MSLHFRPKGKGSRNLCLSAYTAFQEGIPPEDLVTSDPTRMVRTYGRSQLMPLLGEERPEVCSRCWEVFSWRYSYSSGEVQQKSGQTSLEELKRTTSSSDWLLLCEEFRNLDAVKIK